jgi:hypothetical protein
MQIFIGLAILAAYVIVFGLIFRKMGYSPATGLLAIIPIVNLLWLLHLATSDWPIHRQLADLAGRDERSAEDHLALMFKRAESYERRGENREARDLFQLLADELTGQPGAHFAAHCAERLKNRLGAT